ncbi:MAG: hypothetical protein OXF25_01835 [Cyanobacteria bacterium MAG CAR3_bin_5]|nr:hypothetical protein [Cyanobacteria bacterium MAG CAR3_bin_5]
MSIIPCEKDSRLQRQIEEFAEVLKTQAHTLGDHGLSESEFYSSGLFRGAIERIRGQFSATMREKREFVQHILNYMEDEKFISNWESAGEANRSNADEFIIWSICMNTGADPRHSVWSGIHTPLSAEITSNRKRVDGIIIWDMVCGTIGRPCPKLKADPSRVATVGPYWLPPPCLYLLPSTIPSPRSNPNPQAQQLSDVRIMQAFNDCFRCKLEEINYVSFDVAHRGADTVRTTRIVRDGAVQKESRPTAIKRA